MFNPVSETRRPKQDEKMKNNETIVMLEYSIRRCKERGEGVKCQKLLSELNKLRSAAAQAN